MIANDILTHVGVKGMRWGVRRNRNRPGGADGVEESKKIVDKRGKVTKKLDSMKRERDWKKVLNDVDKLTTKEIGAVAKRVGLENDMKKLSKSKIAKPKDKDDYLNRAKMSNDELSRKVTRLRAKENLRSKISDASKEQREFGEKVTQVAQTLVINKYVLKKSVTPKDLFDDLVDASRKPKESSEKATKEAKDFALNVLKTSVRP